MVSPYCVTMLSPHPFSQNFHKINPYNINICASRIFKPILMRSSVRTVVKYFRKSDQADVISLRPNRIGVSKESSSSLPVAIPKCLNFCPFGGWGRTYEILATMLSRIWAFEGLSAILQLWSVATQSKSFGEQLQLVEGEMFKTSEWIWRWEMRPTWHLTWHMIDIWNLTWHRGRWERRGGEGRRWWPTPSRL